MSFVYRKALLSILILTTHIILWRCISIYMNCLPSCWCLTLRPHKHILLPTKVERKNELTLGVLEMGLENEETESCQVDIREQDKLQEQDELPLPLHFPFCIILQKCSLMITSQISSKQWPFLPQKSSSILPSLVTFLSSLVQRTTMSGANELFQPSVPILFGNSWMVPSHTQHYQLVQI
jgi:hypothetical protein